MKNLIHIKSIVLWGLVLLLSFPIHIYGETTPPPVLDGPDVAQSNNSPAGSFESAMKIITLPQQDLDQDTGQAAAEEPMASDPTSSAASWIDQPITSRESLNMFAGNSHILRLKPHIQRISISNPAVADVVILKANEILINARNRGSANLIMWDTEDKVLVYDLTITSDPTLLEAALKSIDSKGDVQVFPTEKGFVVKGNVDTVEAQNKIQSATKAFASESVSVVTVNKAKQILLEIRFIEVDQSTGNEFGIDGHYIAEKVGFTFLGGSTGAQLAADAIESGLLKVSGSNFEFPAIDVTDAQPQGSFSFTNSTSRLNTVIKALEEKNMLKVIAKPNLLVRDGEDASFLVGGEFPVPVVTQNTQSIEYKEFGTRLSYQPLILDDNTVRLRVQTEVSQLDFANGVRLNNFLVPALASRRAVTVAELKSGHSLVIGGLIQQKKTETESGVPVLRNIPLLGRLFENTKNSFSNVELIVLITPHIIDPRVEAMDLKKMSPQEPIRKAVALEPNLFFDERGSAIQEVLTQYERNQTAAEAEKAIENPEVKNQNEDEEITNEDGG